MSRAATITVGSVVGGVLAFVALVSGIMAAAGSSGLGGDPFAFLGAAVDTPATAEVLDVDVYDDWPTVDVRWTTPDGEVVVTYVDWEWGELPVVGDEVEVLYDAADPEFAFAADDPYVSGVPVDPGTPATPGSSGGPEADVAAPGGDDDLSRTAGWVSLAALLGLLVTAVVTIVAAVRAPAPPACSHVPSGFEVPQPSPYQPVSFQPPLPHPHERYQAQASSPAPVGTPVQSQHGTWPHPG